MLVLLYALTTKLNVAHSIIVLAISSLAAFPVIGLSVFHIGLVALGRTTNEQVWVFFFQHYDERKFQNRRIHFT